MQITTKSGFKCEVNENVLSDWRLTRAFAKAHSKNDEDKLMAAVDMVSLILRDSEEDFYRHLDKKGKGVVSEDAVTKDLQSIIEQLKEAKNS